MHTLKVFLIVISIVFTSNSIAQTVFTTKTGEKYHKKSCRYLKYSKKEIKLKEAKKRGCIACKVCKPISLITSYKTSNTTSNSLTNSNKRSTTSSIKKTIATRCTGKTKSRIRCKRKTKNANGRCYQH
ncbi:hypothetical protein C7447_102327 [Tenacibaculum adriaticum]|uniref:Uncharacterized protein n=1 Tax=Tenacibaculum adriaticum TaxID=413713 RepID=A0A5S5DWK0_9FLAO|nr:hypothetical protein [Tenacibaculum adriaticum]TYP99009.1 hypothetical protein C7447_102327 [Tenacibaculum adriaticum]